MGRPKKNADLDLDALVTTKPTEAKDTSNASELDALKEQMAQMMAQMQKLTAENNKLKSSKSTDVNDIDADTDIPVTSLTTGMLVLSTLGNGLGVVYRFNEFGETQDIPFADLREIVKNKQNFAREGAYYIDDEDAVKKLRLERQYQSILDENGIKKFFKGTADNAVKIYNDLPPIQQRQIVSLIEDKLQKKENIDANILVSIGKLAHKDFLYQHLDDEE